MSLDEEYPKTLRRRTGRILRLLEKLTTLPSTQLQELAMSLNQMADEARDLDGIVDRLLNEAHTPAEAAELLIAFELTTEQLRGNSDTIDGKLYEIADRIKGVGKRRRPAVAANGKRKRATA